MIILNKNILNSTMDKIKAEDDLKQHTYEKVKNYQKNNKSFFKSPKVLCTISVCALLLVGIISYFNLRSDIDQTKYSFITIDVNPSLEFILNKDDLVISSKAYNNEGQEILKRISYQNESYQDVLKQLFSDDEYQNYLSSNSDIQVCIFSKNEDKCHDLEKKVDNFIQNHISSNHHYNSICIDEQTHHEAGNHHISSGKYVLIQEIMNHSSYTIDELEDKSLSELKQIYTDTIQPDDKHHNETNEHHIELQHQQYQTNDNTHHQSFHNHH